MSVLTFWLVVALLVGIATWATVCAVAVGREGRLYP
jgi:hypothetical protein